MLVVASFLMIYIAAARSLSLSTVFRYWLLGYSVVSIELYFVDAEKERERGVTFRMLFANFYAFTENSKMRRCTKYLK